jgi:hypothetical protein
MTALVWKSAIGIHSGDAADRQNTVEESFCQYGIAGRQRLIVGDAANDATRARARTRRRDRPRQRRTEIHTADTHDATDLVFAAFDLLRRHFIPASTASSTSGSTG